MIAVSSWQIVVAKIILCLGILTPPGLEEADHILAAILPPVCAFRFFCLREIPCYCCFECLILVFRRWKVTWQRMKKKTIVG